MGECFPFDECDKWGYNLWLIPAGNGSALSRLCPQSDVEADIGYMLTHGSVSECCRVRSTNVFDEQFFALKLLVKKPAEEFFKK